MKQFRISEHVPDVYPRKSRDFQLFCAVFDCLFGELKYNIDSIRNITDTQQCSEKLLSLLQTKLGFFTLLKIPGSDLRLILKAFPTIVRNKGSLKGIQQAVQVYLKLIGLDVDSEVNITNKMLTEEESYIVDISVKGRITDTSILTEILKYVIPAGYKLRYSYKIGDNINTTIIPTDSVEIITGVKDNIGFEELNSGLRKSDDTYSMLLGRVDTATVKKSKDNDVSLKNKKIKDTVDNPNEELSTHKITIE